MRLWLSHLYLPGQLRSRLELLQRPEYARLPILLICAPGRTRRAVSRGDHHFGKRIMPRLRGLLMEAARHLVWERVSSPVKKPPRLDHRQRRHKEIQSADFSQGVEFLEEQKIRASKLRQAATMMKAKMRVLLVPCALC